VGQADLDTVLDYWNGGVLPITAINMQRAPEPATLSLLALGAVVIARRRRT
jgi:hypothetical protein